MLTHDRVQAQPTLLFLLAMTLSVILAVILAPVANGQGIGTRSSAVVFHGSPTNCSQPATIDHRKVRKATPEWQTIRSEGVRRGSGRHALLISAMNSRVTRACRIAAEASGRDCVVRKGDITDRRGLSVRDLTERVLRAVKG